MMVFYKSIPDSVCVVSKLDRALVNKYKVVIFDFKIKTSVNEKKPLDLVYSGHELSIAT